MFVDAIRGKSSVKFQDYDFKCNVANSISVDRGAVMVSAYYGACDTKFKIVNFKTTLLEVEVLSA